MLIDNLYFDFISNHDFNIAKAKYPIILKY